MIEDSALFKARILIVDDQRPDVLLLEQMLRHNGFSYIKSTTDSSRALDLYNQFQPDLVVLDLKMPVLDGFQVMEKMLLQETGSYAPILVLTGQTDPRARLRALKLGARDFLNKPFDQIEVISRIKNLVEVRLLFNQVRSQNQFLEETVRERTQKLQQTRLQIINRLGQAAEYRDNETGLHVIRMSQFSAKLARAAGQRPSVCDLILNASPMHDVGKIGIPDRILLKPGKLDAEEWEIMKSHVAIGARILSGGESPLLKMAEVIALTHHEKWDGTGYPKGLQGDKIPFVGRIVALCDVFDALTSERPYKKPWSIPDTMKELERLRGKHFDPAMVDWFRNILPEILQIKEKYDDPPVAESPALLKPAGHAPADSTVPSPLSKDQLQNAKILIVDDKLENVKLLEAILKEEGFRSFKSTTDSKKALEIHDSYQPDLILLDLKMPPPDGFQILEQLKLSPHETRAFVLVLTGVTDRAIRLKALASGSKDYLNKPFDFDEVSLRIKNLVETRMLQKEVLRQNQLLSHEIQLKHANLTQAHEKLGQEAARREKIQKELGSNEERLRKIIEKAHDGFVVLNKDGSILEWNAKAEKTFGWSKSEVVGKKFADWVVTQKNKKGFEENLALFTDGPNLKNKNLRSEFDVVRKDQTELPVEILFFLMRHNELERINIFLDDITQRKILQAQLNQAQKMESIGQLAAGIAHEINTPTQYINDNLHFLQETMAELLPLREKLGRLNPKASIEETNNYLEELGKELRELDFEYISTELPLAIDQSLEGINRIARIVRAMKEFSHPGTGEKAPIDIHRAIGTTITVSRNEWKYVAEMKTDFDPALPPVPCLADQFNQVLLNLIVNAAHAIEETLDQNSTKLGAITITTRKDEDWAEIRVQDTGGGIPKNIRARIFDPFFTTKEVGKGTGQGLAIVHSAIQKHDGRISVESEIGKGTTFIIRLPLHPPFGGQS